MNSLGRPPPFAPVLHYRILPPQLQNLMIARACPQPSISCSTVGSHGTRHNDRIIYRIKWSRCAALNYSPQLAVNQAHRKISNTVGGFPPTDEYCLHRLFLSSFCDSRQSSCRAYKYVNSCDRQVYKEVLFVRAVYGGKRKPFGQSMIALGQSYPSKSSCVSTLSFTNRGEVVTRITQQRKKRADPLPRSRREIPARSFPCPTAPA
jgi:hypothetical protein